MQKLPKSKRLTSNVFPLRGVIALLFLLTAHGAQAAPPTPADFGWKNMEAKGERPLLIILIQDPSLPALARDAKFFDELFFGSDATKRSVNRYFAAVSGNRLTWSRAGVVGTYTVTIRSGEKVQEDAVLAAAKKGFDFSKFDRNQDGLVTVNELGIVVVDNTKTNSGQTNGVNASLDKRDPVVGATLVKCQVRMRVAGIGPQTSLMTICHEMMHTLGAKDLYGGTGLNTKLTTMAGTDVGVDDRQTYYLDPWHRMQFGWVDPQVRDLRTVASFGLAVPQLVEKPRATPPSPLILYDSERGLKEFFILEYRHNKVGPKGHYDADVASNGVAIWHVKQDDRKQLINVPRDGDAKKIDVISLFSRGAPDWKQGGNTLYTKEHGNMPLWWMDRGRTGFRLEVIGRHSILVAGELVPRDPDSVLVRWTRTSPPLNKDMRYDLVLFASSRLGKFVGGTEKNGPALVAAALAEIGAKPLIVRKATDDEIKEGYATATKEMFVWGLLSQPNGRVAYTPRVGEIIQFQRCVFKKPDGTTWKWPHHTGIVAWSNDRRIVLLHQNGFDDNSVRQDFLDLDWVQAGGQFLGYGPIR